MHPSGACHVADELAADAAGRGSQESFRAWHRACGAVGPDGGHVTIRRTDGGWRCSNCLPERLLFNQVRRFWWVLKTWMRPPCRCAYCTDWLAASATCGEV